MKKILTSIALLGLLAAGCTNADNIISSTDETPGADIEDVAGGATSYLTFGLVTTSGTRAGLPDGYEYGKAYENSVKNVRFYFFNEEGDPVNVKKNPAKESKYDSFYDYSDKLNDFEEVDLTEEDAELTVEKTINITLVLTPEEGKVPTRVVAILNPTADLIADKTNYKQSELVAKMDDYLPDPDKLNDSEENKGQFVITSSVYAKDSEKINYTTIKLKRNDDGDDGELYQSVEEARENKTTIFVERVVARIDLTVGKSTSSDLKNTIKPVAGSGETFTGTDTKDVYYTNKKYKKYNSPEGAAGDPIFVKFLGWTVTSTPVKSYLVKEIDPTWKDVENGEVGLFNKMTEPWNDNKRFRSYWAINPELIPAYSENIKNKLELGYKFYSYNDIIAGGTAHHAFAGDGEPYASMYIQENAADAEEGYSATPGLESKVIVAAQLLTPEGKPREIVEYGFMYYDAADLLQYFADQLSLVFYSNKNDKENSGLSESDIEYKTQAQYLEQEGVDVPGGYFSYVALKKSATGSNDNKWYRDIEGVATAQTETQVNEYIQGVVSNRLLYWKDGKTYYYFPIQHLGGLVAEGEGEPGPGPGYYGVVRNHIYKADISGLTGLGTPVLDPTETIYPEHPTHDDYLLAAEIKVLAWRIVQQDYEFTW
ncbi:MAG: Mfa1 fimbrilin C-terminal domain-containing protein [Alistipes sp.]|nr:Mfa1 fimbrilin C-terminal domain-containing protein [Alistipes sp.]